MSYWLKTFRRTRLGVCCAVLLVTQAVLPAASLELRGPIKDLAAAADKEGTLTLSWSQSTLGGSQGAARIEAAMNKMFGTNIHLNFVPGPDMARIFNQVATEFSAGQNAHVDLLLGAAAQIVPVVKLDMFQAFDWDKYLPVGTPPITELDNKIVRIVTGISGVTYNSAMAPSTPKTLADFLKPEWKGKIASTPYAASFDVLLADDVWGPAKTIAYVRQLSSQISGLIRCGEAERIATGEYLALVMDCTGQDALQWQEKGAPLAQMMPSDAAQERYYYLAVPKNSPHPNADALFTLFLLTDAGQQLAYETWKTDLHLLPGSHMGKMVADAEKAGVKFKEVTVEWWLRHPEIDTQKSELIKILTTKQ